MNSKTMLIIAAVIIYALWGCPHLAQRYGGPWNQAGYYGRSY
jgi:hypothetical protein